MIGGWGGVQKSFSRKLPRLLCQRCLTFFVSPNMSIAKASKRLLIASRLKKYLAKGLKKFVRRIEPLLLSRDWMLIQDRIKEHPDFDRWFVEYPEDTTWMEANLFDGDASEHRSEKTSLLDVLHQFISSATLHLLTNCFNHFKAEAQRSYAHMPR